MTDAAPHVLFLCTGNAARSVMAGAILMHRMPHVRVTTAGTHVIEGQPMSWRTRSALSELGLAADAHRSKQLRPDDLSADLIVGMAREHVEYVRRRHPEAAARTGTLRRLARGLHDAPGDTLHEKVAALELASVELESWEDVDDPAGGDAPIFHACAEDLLQEVEALAVHLAR